MNDPRRALALLLLSAATGAMLGCGDRCGDGAIDPGEACDSREASACQTACGTSGTRTCDRCAWSACAPPAEVCNARDDDCDGAIDETSTCAAGARRECTTSCGSRGSQACSDACAWQECAPPHEVCGNGADDDCDGAIDTTVLRGEPVTLASLWGRGHALARTEAGYVLAHRVGRQVFQAELVLSRFDDEGRPLGADEPTGIVRELRSDDGMTAVHAGGVSGAGVLAVAWAEGRSGAIVALREGASAAALPYLFASDSLGGASRRAPMVWTGSELWLAYGHRPDAWSSVRLQRVGADGRSIGAPIALTPVSADEPSYVALAWDGEAAGVVWVQDPGVSREPDVYFARAGAGGPIGEVVQLTAGDEDLSEQVRHLMPAIAHDGEGFAIVWSEGSMDRGQLRLARVDARGQRRAPDRAIARSRRDAIHPAIVWSGAELGVAWLDWDVGRDRGEVRFVRLDRDGRPVGEAVAVGALARREPVELLWTGREYAVSFVTEGEAGASVRLARIGCE